MSLQSYSSLYPNHVHQLTVCVSKHYYITNNGVVKFQNKKIEMNLDKVKDSKRNHLLHYVLRDHFSGVIYSEVTSSKDMIALDEFLFRAWSKKEKFIFCGIPEFLTIPKTVEKSFPTIRKKVSLLNIQFPKVTSGFQSGVRDIKTIEEYMKFYVNELLDDVIESLNKIYIYLSTMEARVGKQTKLEFWRQHIESVMVPPESWKNIA